MDVNELNKQWHQAFYSAARLELDKDRDNVEFIEEHNLSHDPLRMDLLIIKKRSKLPMNNEIGHIFRKYNICEYKSPEDGLTIDDYYKTIAYACLYKSLSDKVNEIRADEITVTLVREGYPYKLIKQLESSGCRMKQYSPGVYYIEGNTLFPVQIVVTKRLGKGHHTLKVLTKKITQNDIKTFIKETASMIEKGQKMYVNAVYQVSLLANMEAYDDVKRRYPKMCEALKILMKPELDEAIKTGLEQGKKDLFTVITRVKKGATESVLLDEGFSADDIKMAIEALK